MASTQEESVLSMSTSAETAADTSHRSDSFFPFTASFAAKMKPTKLRSVSDFKNLQAMLVRMFLVCISEFHGSILQV